MKKCIHVSISDFNRFTNDDKCYRTINLRDDIDGDIIAWMRFFNGKSRKQFEEMAKTNEYIKEACDTVIKISADEIKRYEYEAREKAIRDYNWGLKSARRQGKEETKKIFKLHMQGKSPEEIADICGVPLDDVRQTID